MSEWSAGYMAEIDYTYGYYTELNPLRARFALLQHQLRTADTEFACELGFGQGVTVNVHASASNVRWYGTDFNPAHASHAQDLAQSAGNGARLEEQAFADFCHRSDLPDFDFIGMHGIWSWISDANRAVLVDFLARKLKPGGVLYVSYNTQPGWAAMAPIRELFADHASMMSAPGLGAVNRVHQAIDFVQQLMASKPVYALLNPDLSKRIAKLKEYDPHYLAHEYFNQHWQPMSFSRAFASLNEAKLQWACSANFMDSLDLVNLNEEQRTLLASIPDPNFRQSVFDFCINQQFRKDYWVKGLRPLSPQEQNLQWQQQGFVLLQPAAEVSLKLTGRQAEMSLSPQLYTPLLEQLSDHQVHSGEELEHALQHNGLSPAAVRQALWVLCSTGAVAPAQTAQSSTQARTSSMRLNAHLLSPSAQAKSISVLASPITGGGISASSFELQFLRARQLGAQDPAQWAQMAWDELQSKGQCLIQDGHPLLQPADNLSALENQARTFAHTRLPLLEALGAAERA